MSTKPRRFFSADTLERARLEAAAHYGLEPEDLAYTVRDKRHGFLKIRRRVVIEVDPQAPRRPAGEAAGPAGGGAEAPARRPTAEAPSPPERPRQPPGSGRERPAPPPAAPRLRPAAAPPAGPTAAPGEGEFVPLPEAPRRRAEKLEPAGGESVAAARQALEAIFEFLGVELEAELFEAEEGLEIELSGPDQEVVLDDEGEMLRAIQHLVPRLMLGFGAEPVAVRVDCDNFLEIRQEKLRHLAQSAAERVKRTGRPALLDPLNPADRRTVHLTLSPDAAVVTESQGEGFMKRIVIRPRSRVRDEG